MYDSEQIDKTLTIPTHGVSNFILKICKRFVCLNLIKELELDKYRAKDANKQKIEEPKFEDIDEDAKWTAYINSLRAVPELKSGGPTLGSTLKDSFVKPIKEGVEVLDLKEAYQEMYSWNDGNKGQILVGTGKDTYYMDDKANMRKVESFPHFLAPKDNTVETPITNFLSKIKEVLLNI